ncbi:MAG TPA: ATP-binding protein [Herpetosiphonaceae bacterium]|nr:ATP-binding protein [Herpetosiphonaceae bacterium]
MWQSVVFEDHVLATAILDRLLHHATTLNVKGESYRLKEKRRAGLLGPARSVEEGGTAGTSRNGAGVEGVVEHFDGQDRLK